MATSRWQVQYQEIADSLFPPPVGVADTAGPDTLMVFPGIALDYQAYAEPPQGATTAAVVLPAGVAAYLAVYPNETRIMRLPELGTIFVFQFPFEIAGGALSWMPVYGGRAGLPPALFPSSVLSTQAYVPDAVATPLSWSPVYPFMPGLTPRGLPSALIPDVTTGFVPITNPAGASALNWFATYPDFVLRPVVMEQFFHPPQRLLVTQTGNAFILDASTLAGAQYRTVPFDMAGEFRQVQFHWQQAGASQDMEPHYLEFHFTVSGVGEEA